MLLGFPFIPFWKYSALGTEMTLQLSIQIIIIFVKFTNTEYYYSLNKKHFSMGRQAFLQIQTEHKFCGQILEVQ